MIIGKLIPAGTGMARYRNVKVFSKNEALPELPADELIAEAAAPVPEEEAAAEAPQTNVQN